MRVATIIFGVLCLGMGAAFAVVFAILTVDNLQYPNPIPTPRGGYPEYSRWCFC